MMGLTLARGLLLGAGLALLPALAWADPITILVALQPIIGGAAAAFVASAITFVAAYGSYALLAYSVYGTLRARREARKRAAQARAAYNASLTDRTVTVLSEFPPARTVYGRCDVGGAVVAIFATDKTRPDGSTKADGYKHLVVVWSSRQCQAIHDIKVEGVALGTLDANGWAVDARWRIDAPNDSQTISAGPATYTLPSGALMLGLTLAPGGFAARVSIERAMSWRVIPEGGVNGWSVSGGVLSLPSVVIIDGAPYTVDAGNDEWEINYTTSAATGTSVIRALHHLGAPDQAADATLMALLPSQWTSAHRLRGLCYSVITLDLEFQQFQGGIPGLVADVSGALVLDRRTGLTAWSDNTALCTDDWLRSELGYNLPLAGVNAASAMAAANACDATAGYGRRYTCNGVVSADMARESVLQDLCEAMGGMASYAGEWRIQAGAWVPPVMDLTDDDLAGAIEIVQAGEPSSELFNSVRARFYPARTSVAADMVPYQNNTFVTADGRALWTDLEFPFTDELTRCHQLARMRVEQSRNGLVILFPAKLRAWPLQPGDRVRVTSAEYGWTAKTFMVGDWAFGLRSPVLLTLQEDVAEVYDEVDAVTADPTPNTGLPDPAIVAAITPVTPASGTAHLQQLGDGTIISRVRLTWPAPTGAYMAGGYVEVRWRTAGSDTWAVQRVSGTDTACYLSGVVDGTVVVYEVTAINSLGARSSGTWGQHQVLGKLEHPDGFGGLAATIIPGALRLDRSGEAPIDWAYSVYEYTLDGGTTWLPVPAQAGRTGVTWPWPPLGAMTVRGYDVDTSGLRGTPVAVPVTVTSALLLDGAQIDAPAEWLNSNVGAVNLLYGTQLAGQAGPGVYGYTLAVLMDAGAAYDPFALRTGDVLTISAEVWQDATSLAAGQYAALFLYAQASGGLWVATAAISDASTPGGAGRQAASLVLPSMGFVQRVAVGIYHQGGASNTIGTVYADRVQVERGPSATQYKPGVQPGATAGAPAGTMVAGQAAESLVADAATAKSTANTAASNATSALSALATMRSNGYIDAAEKPALIKQWLAVDRERPGIYSSATAYGRTTERDAYQSAYTTLASYLGGLSPSWDDTSTDTPVTPALDQSTWAAYYSARQAVLDAIAAEAGQRATWSGVTGTGRPADNATRNYTYRQATDPGGINGETWLNTSNGRTYVKVEGVWVYTIGDASVDTAQLTGQAATEIYAATATNVTVTGQTGTPSGSFTDLVSITFTASVTGQVELTAEGAANIATPSSGDPSAAFAVLSTRITVNGSQVGPLRTYHRFDEVGFGQSGIGAAINRSRRIDVSAGTTYTFILQAQKLDPAVTTTVTEVQMRAALIKR